MKKKSFTFTSVKAIGLALVSVAALDGTAWGQGIIHVVPSTPFYYSDLPSSQNIDINGDGIPDFNLNSPNGIQIDLNPLNQNSVLAVPEPSPNFGVLIAALMLGTVIPTSPSSLDPALVWYGTNSIYGGTAGIVAASNIGSIGYFQGNTNAYAGFQLNVGGENYLGWLYIQNLGLNIGQITSWAYQSSPNTSIPAGAVPEPSTWALLVLGCLVLAARHLRTT